MICLGFFCSFKVGEKLNYEKDDNTTDSSNTLKMKVASNFLLIITMMVNMIFLSSERVTKVHK